MPSTRSVWKGPYVSWSLVRHWIKSTQNKEQVGSQDLLKPVSSSLKKGEKPKPISNQSLKSDAPRLSRKPKNFRTWSRGSTILPSFVGSNFQIHNGKSFTKITVTQDMVGHKFGEFSMTRKTILKGSSKKKSKTK